MNRYPESEFGIRLNTFTCYLEPTPGEKLRSAHNDPLWSAVQGNRVGTARKTLTKGGTPNGADKAANDKSLRSINRRVASPHPLIKHWITAGSINRYLRHNDQTSPHRYATILELDCKLQTFRRFLSKPLKRAIFIGVDREPRHYPDQVADINNTADRQHLRALKPDIIVSFEALHARKLTIVQARTILSQLAELSAKGTLVYFSAPQQVTKKRPSKLSQSHDSNLSAQALTIKQWEALIDEFFSLCEVRSLGLFTAGQSNLSNRAQHYSRGLRFKLSDSINHLLSLIDLVMTLVFGKYYLFKRCSHSLLFVVEPKQC